MKDKNFIQDALNTIKIEGNAVLALRDQIKDDFERLCKTILDTKGKLKYTKEPFSKKRKKRNDPKKKNRNI